MTIRQVIQSLERDGWRLDRHTGTHRVLRHRERPGTITLAGKATDVMPEGALASVWRQAGRPGGEQHS